MVDVGETIEWTLYVRNGGDGPAAGRRGQRHQHASGSNLSGDRQSGSMRSNREYEAGVAHRTGVAISFSAERLDRALRFIDEARFGGLVTHLFALRAFLPDAFGDAHAAHARRVARIAARRT